MYTAFVLTGGGSLGAIQVGMLQVLVTKYDEAEEHMIHLADTLTLGIIAQFPDSF